MNAAVSAAVWVVGKALAPVSDGLLENWAASDSLGTNISDLRKELLRAQGILYTTHGRDITNPALKDQLNMLRRQADEADDVLDELDYFRIHDKLNNTYHAADNHPGGCIHGLGLNLRHTTRAIASKFKLSSCLCNASGGDHDYQDAAKQGCLSVVRTCGGRDSIIEDGQKMKFNRVEMSKRMSDIVQELHSMCSQVKEILGLELRKPTKAIVENRTKTTATIIEPELFGREAEKKEIIDGITDGKYCADGLTVLPIVGPGGIGKTTFTQHVYQEVKSSFDVCIWVCVSQSFDAGRLIQEIVKRSPEVNGEMKNATDEERIEQRLKHKRFLLVLDDVWRCHEDEWRKILAPLGEGEARGNMVIVTTRIPETAAMVKKTDSSIDLNCLQTEDCLHLFEACVFGHQQSLKYHPELLDVSKKIVVKLKGFPLAVKTVGRLLRNQLTLDHWTRVLESKEWEFQTDDNDIMPALKLSYDYLPFHLQQCFSYCGLFPEDYEFGCTELVHLWIGLNILDSCDQRKTPEDVGLGYLNDLVNLGFLKKNKKDDGSPCYVVHDLLHDLAVKVSSSECLSISRSNARYAQSSPSVRHLSIIVDERDVNDRVSFEDFKRDLSTLQRKLKVEYLQTVMLFGKFHGSFARTFGDLFVEAKSLRVILLSEASYSYILEDVFCSLPRFVHLRYLRITTGEFTKLSLNSNISRFYHLRVLVIEQHNARPVLPILMNEPRVSLQKVSNLGKLRHFLVDRDTGFELRQIGQLEELGGSLIIHNIENVERKEEVNEANLIHKNHLEKLLLQWGIYGENMYSVQEYVLESLKPHSNLLDLHIEGHRGTSCPSWLGGNLSVKNLESLRLHDVGWKILPPIGELWFVGEEKQSCIPSQSFQNLKRLELVKILKLIKWVENNTSHLFSQLEVLIVKDCSELVELPFTCCQSEEEAANMTCFPRLRELEIIDCPKLLSLPPVPWTFAPCSAKIERAGSGLEKLSYSTEYRSELNLSISGSGGQDDMFWNVLAFSNLADLKKLKIKNCPPLPLDPIQKLTSLKSLEIDYSSNSNVLSPTDSESDVIYKFPVEHLEIMHCGAGEKELTQFLSHFQDLSELEISDCEKITRVGVMGEQQQTTRGEEEIAAGGDGGLLFSSPNLQKLGIKSCPELSLLASSLQGLRSLRSLVIRDCPKLASSYSPLLAHGCLTVLHIFNTPKFFASFQHQRAHQKEPTSCKLQMLSTDDLTGLLVVPKDCLPTSLQSLVIMEGHAFKLLPDVILPSSLQYLWISGCPSLESLPNDSLPSSLQRLSISSCGSLKSLPCSERFNDLALSCSEIAALL